MEQKILEELTVIKGLLVWIVILLTVFIGSSIFKRLASMFASMQSAYYEYVIEKSKRIYERADYEKLLVYVNKKLVKSPNNATLIYWKARAKYAAKEYDEAEMLFNKLEELEPSWKEEHVLPYINKIKQNTNKAHQPE